MTLSIKDHIEAGHYPKDDKGRALVPTHSEGKFATVCATDAPGDRPLLGFYRGIDRYHSCPFISWDENGNHSSQKKGSCWVDLLPPPPRKVRRCATLMIPVKNGEEDTRKEEVQEGDHTGNQPDNPYWRYVLLTGEYEEPWS